MRTSDGRSAFGGLAATNSIETGNVELLGHSLFNDLEAPVAARHPEISKVKAAFVEDKQVGAMNIKVDTDKGVVKLSGNAKSKDEADKAASIAKSTKGVVSVKNDIQLMK